MSFKYEHEISNEEPNQASGSLPQASNSRKLIEFSRRNLFRLIAETTVGFSLFGAGLSVSSGSVVEQKNQNTNLQVENNQLKEQLQRYQDLLLAQQALMEVARKKLEILKALLESHNAKFLLRDETTPGFGYDVYELPQASTDRFQALYFHFHYSTIDAGLEPLPITTNEAGQPESFFVNPQQSVTVGEIVRIDKRNYDQHLTNRTDFMRQDGALIQLKLSDDVVMRGKLTNVGWVFEGEGLENSIYVSDITEFPEMDTLEIVDGPAVGGEVIRDHETWGEIVMGSSSTSSDELRGYISGEKYQGSLIRIKYLGIDHFFALPPALDPSQTQIASSVVRFPNFYNDFLLVTNAKTQQAFFLTEGTIPFPFNIIREVPKRMVNEHAYQLHHEVVGDFKLDFSPEISSRLESLLDELSSAADIDLVIDIIPPKVISVLSGSTFVFTLSISYIKDGILEEYNFPIEHMSWLTTM